MNIGAVSAAQAIVPGSQDAEIATNRGLRIGILMVAYNAVGTLVQVLRRIPEAVWENIDEVAVFDDASDDATYELAIGYKTLTDAKLRVVRNVKNRGYGGNQKAGYKYFMDNGFDVVVLLHGDGQYAPEILHHLYQPIVNGQADAVFGSRMMSRYGGALHGGMPLYKYAGNRILSAFQNHELGMNLTEFHSGYRAYNLHALRKIDMSAMTDDFHFDSQIIIKLHHQGFRITEVPIPTYYGNEICYVNGLKYAFDVVKSVLRYKSTIRSARRHPEYAEYFVNYPLKDNKYSSHGVVQRLLGANQDVLDIGCGEGFFARAIKRNGNTIAGIDIIPSPRLRNVFSSYICADLNNGLSSAKKKLAGATFDKILLMDTLQQLRNPAAILRDARGLLRPNGRILVSLPNVANITVRAGLALGNFQYSDRGILDQTHVRFFTRMSAKALLRQCGYKVISEHATIMPLEFVLDRAPSNLLLKAAHRVLAAFTSAFPALFGYQWVFVARPETDG